ncbi:MAG: hypothetical protein BRD55_08255 [Bacteroidetes bacterium SW_9_63_38]|nr:MAG: hypothetical protein BRD55_08255 [Bacteroidetes bacterium SW_9_63_38]
MATPRKTLWQCATPHSTSARDGCAPPGSGVELADGMARRGVDGIQALSSTAGTGVTIRVGRAGNDILCIEDDGSGMSSRCRGTVFEPGRTSRTEGTGFGLTTVERTADAQGWRVPLTEEEGGGVRFEFRDCFDF